MATVRAALSTIAILSLLAIGHGQNCPYKNEQLRIPEPKLEHVEYSTNTTMWKVPLPKMRSTVYVDDKRVYTGTFDGKFKAFDKHTGEEVWSVSSLSPSIAGTDKSERQPILGEPLPHKDFVIFTTGTGRVFAFKKETGEMVWRYHSKGFIKAGALRYSDEMIVFVNRNGKIVALNPDTGVEIWAQHVEGIRFDAKPTTDGTLIFVSGVASVKDREEKGFVAAFTSNGKMKWKAFFAKEIHTSAVPFGPDLVDLLIQDNSGSMFVVEAETSVRKYGKNFAHPQGEYVKSSPIGYKGDVYFGTLYGSIEKFGAWSYGEVKNTEEPVASDVYVGEEFVYAARGPFLFIINRETGKAFNNIGIHRSNSISSPRPDPENPHIVYVGTEDGLVACYTHTHFNPYREYSRRYKKLVKEYEKETGEKFTPVLDRYDHGEAVEATYVSTEDVYAHRAAGRKENEKRKEEKQDRSNKAEKKAKKAKAAKSKQEHDEL